MTAVEDLEDAIYKLVWERWRVLTRGQIICAMEDALKRIDRDLEELLADASSLLRKET